MKLTTLFFQRLVMALFLFAIVMTIYGAHFSTVAAQLERGEKLPLLVTADKNSRLLVFDPKNNFMDELAISKKRTPDALNEATLQRVDDFPLHFPGILTSPRTLWRFLCHASSSLTFWDRMYFLSAARHLTPSRVGAYHSNAPGLKHSDQNAMADSLVGQLMSNTEAMDTSAIAPQANRITVKVWNASGKPGLAYSVTRFLRQKGFDVVEWGNHAAQEAQTRVIDRKGIIRNARDAAVALGVETFVSEPNPNALVDVEILIGQNFSGKLTESR